MVEIGEPMRTKHLIHGNEVIKKKKPFRTNDMIYIVPKLSFFDKDDAKEKWISGRPVLRLKAGENIAIAKLKDEKIMDGGKLSLLFNGFDDFALYFNFDRYYFVREYVVEKIEGKHKQLKLEMFL